jgi:DNA-binding transcriptional LysR family regulator
VELRHLKYFVMVSEELNFSRASARLRVSQPAVSRQIKDLEEEVGAQLFVRAPSGITLTPAGETFLAHARDILRRSADSLKAMQAFGKSASRSVALGYIPTALPSFLTDALRRFSDQYPNAAVHLREMSPQEQLKALREENIDLAFIGSPCPELQKQFDLTIVKKIPLSVALPDNHRLAKRKGLELKELSKDDFIGLADDRFPGRNEFICKTCQSAGFTPKMTWKADSFSSMLALVASGKGVALLPSEMGLLPHTQAVFISLRRCSAKVEWAVASRRGHQNETADALLGLLKQ